MSSLRGEGGEIRWGYQLAGVLDFTITQDTDPPKTLVVRGRVQRLDWFSVMQRPLVFIWPIGARRWTYPIAKIEITQDHVTARLGPRQDG